MAYYKRNLENPYGRSARAECAEREYKFPASKITWETLVSAAKSDEFDEYLETGEQYVECEWNGSHIVEKKVSETLAYEVTHLYEYRDEYNGMRDWLKRHGVTVAKVKELGDEGEWHHYGKYANRVNVIDVPLGVMRAIREWEETHEDRAE
jgi:hypothetical protein